MCDTHLPPSRCPPQSQTPGYQCCHLCFLQVRCRCSDLQGQQKKNQGHFNTQALRYQSKLRPQGKKGCTEHHKHIAPGTAGKGEGGLLPRLAPLSKTAKGKTAKALWCPCPHVAVHAGMLQHCHGTSGLSRTALAAIHEGRCDVDWSRAAAETTLQQATWCQK